MFGEGVEGERNQLVMTRRTKRGHLNKRLGQEQVRSTSRVSIRFVPTDTHSTLLGGKYRYNSQNTNIDLLSF